MDLVLPDSKEKVIGKHTLPSLLSLPVDCRGEVKRWIYPQRIFHFHRLHCFERESTFKDAAESQTSYKFIAPAMSQRCDCFKDILIQSNENFALVMCSAILNSNPKS